jgi:hypothetical protein
MILTCNSAVASLIFGVGILKGKCQFNVTLSRHDMVEKWVLWH